MWSYDYLTPFIIDVAVCVGYDIYNRKARLFLTSLLYCYLHCGTMPFGIERTDPCIRCWAVPHREYNSPL